MWDFPFLVLFAAHIVMAVTVLASGACSSRIALALTLAQQKESFRCPRGTCTCYEVVDVVGQGQYDYMEHLWKDPVLRMPEMFGLQGAFYVCAAGGGRWPQVVNIWDIGSKGWTGWAANVDRMNLKRRKAFYGDWWDEAAKWRSGGFDRLCGGVPGQPDDRGDRGARASRARCS